MNKEGSYKPLIFVMIFSLLIAFLWNQLPFLKNAIHFVLDPSLGFLLRWNLTVGMLILVLLISVISILAQKYGTDQETLREIRKEQKKMQEEMKSVREHPEKMAELNKKQMDIMSKSMKLSTRPIMFTGIPFILLFRWFSDLFTAGTNYTLTANPLASGACQTGYTLVNGICSAANPMFFGFMSWFWFYLIFTLVFSMVLRKVFKVV